MIGCIPISAFFSSDPTINDTPADRGLIYEDIWFPAKDGVQLHAWYIKGKPEYPLLLYFHGNDTNISHYMKKYACLNSMGFQILIFDYRGYGESRGKVTKEEDFYGDARGALDYLKERGWSPSEMVYYGHSIGTAVAIQMALEYPPSGLVLEAPFTTFPDLAKHTNYVMYQLLGRWFLNVRFDNLKKIENISSPLLVIHGFQDTTVPWEMSYRLFERARGQKKYRLVPGAGHSDAYEVQEELYRKALLEFMDELNGARQSQLLVK